MLHLLRTLGAFARLQSAAAKSEAIYIGALVAAPSVALFMKSEMGLGL